MTSRKPSIELDPPRGTRDFPPDDMRMRSWLFAHYRAVARAFGFEEYDAPVLEHEELYTRKAGEEITQQLYNFEDKGGRRVALRPEMTPSLVRLVMQLGKSAPMPLKWFSIPQCWRYERMTRGRKREHYQWNMDIIGVHEVTAEAELLAAIVMFFERLGLTADDIGIKVSSRKVLQSILAREGVTDELFPAVCVIVDKLEKLPREAIEKELAALGLSQRVLERILQSLALRDLDALREQLGDDHPAYLELKQLFALAEQYGYVSWLRFDASIVRGLAYYTGVIFEAFDRGEQLRAICGGGRYDRLFSMFGGEDLPAVGFGFGDVVILEALKDRGLLPEPHAHVDDVVFAMDESLRAPAVELAMRLRRTGRSVDLVLEPKKAKWAFKHADRLHASRVMVLGLDEWATRSVRCKDMRTGDEVTVDFAQAACITDTPSPDETTA
jgi:histidyl-tRNA synthetase